MKVKTILIGIVIIILALPFIIGSFVPKEKIVTDEESPDSGEVSDVTEDSPESNKSQM